MACGSGASGAGGAGVATVGALVLILVYCVEEQEKCLFVSEVGVNSNHSTATNLLAE